jgi:phage terminase small subunit
MDQRVTGMELSQMLTPKQRRFVDEYLASPNGTQAAIKAGYSAKTARAIASENLRKPEVKAAVERGALERRQQFKIEEARVREELSNIAFASMGDVWAQIMKSKNPKDWSHEDWNGIASVRYREVTTSGPKGKRKLVSWRAKVKMGGKLKALDLLAEHLGMYRLPDAPPVQVIYSISTDGGPPVPVEQAAIGLLSRQAGTKT